MHDNRAISNSLVVTRTSGRSPWNAGGAYAGHANNLNRTKS